MTMHYKLLLHVCAHKYQIMMKFQCHILVYFNILIPKQDKVHYKHKSYSLDISRIGPCYKCHKRNKNVLNEDASWGYSDINYVAPTNILNNND